MEKSFESRNDRCSSSDIFQYHYRFEIEVTVPTRIDFFGNLTVLQRWRS